MNRTHFVLAVALAAIFSLSTYFSLDSARDKSQDVLEDVRQSIYMLQTPVDRGTGWIARAKSGKLVMVTNVHVCDTPFPFMYTKRDYGVYKLNIIAKDDLHDICLLEAPPNATPLPMAQDLGSEETIYAVGYPIIEFMSSNIGLSKGYSYTEIPQELPIERCVGFKYRIKTYQPRKPNSKPKQICVFAGLVLVTTTHTDAGGSGSPILNRNEEVVGMIMAVTGRISWGMGVPLSSLKEFLDRY